MPSNHTPIAYDQSGHSLRILTPSLRILTPTLRILTPVLRILTPTLRILTPVLRILTPTWPLSPYGSRAKRHPQVILQVILQVNIQNSLLISLHFDPRSTGMPLTRQMPHALLHLFRPRKRRIQSVRLAANLRANKKRLNLGRTGLPYSFFLVSVNFNKSSVNNKTRR